MVKLAKICTALTLALFPLLASTQDTEELQRTPPPKIPPISQDLPEVPLEEPPPEVATPDTFMDELGQRWNETEATSSDGADASEEDAASTGTNSDSPASDHVVYAFLKGIMALCGTLALFILLLAAVKRWGRRTPLLSGYTLGKVLGRIALSPQASLHFIRVKDEVLIVGATQQSVNLLRVMEADLFEEENAIAPEPDDDNAIRPANFLAELQASQASLDHSSSGMDEELDNLKGDLQRLKQYFQESSRAQD